MIHSVVRSLVLWLLVATLPGSTALFFGGLDCNFDILGVLLGVGSNLFLTARLIRITTL